MTKTPKILPWIARRAGISDERAEALWRKAAGQAARQASGIGSADYYRAAIECLHELAARESSAQAVGT
jgi:hypothetical protein